MQHSNIHEYALDALAAALIAVGLAGAIVPAVPGIPLIFAGIWLLAWLDDFEHIGRWWLVSIALVGAFGLAIDLLASALGAKRVGASKQAITGALIGTVVGLFFGLPGLLIGPFCGAVGGELVAGGSVSRSTQVGVAAWLGLLLGTVVKLTVSVMMIGMLLAGWWFHRQPREIVSSIESSLSLEDSHRLDMGRERNQIKGAQRTQA